MKRILEINGKKYKRIAEGSKYYTVPKANDIKPYIRKHKVDVKKISMGSDGPNEFDKYLKVQSKKGNFIEINNEMIEVVMPGRGGYVHSIFRNGKKSDYDEGLKALAKADKLAAQGWSR